MTDELAECGQRQIKQRQAITGRKGGDFRAQSSALIADIRTETSLEFSQLTFPYRGIPRQKKRENRGAGTTRTMQRIDQCSRQRGKQRLTVFKMLRADSSDLLRKARGETRSTQWRCRILDGRTGLFLA